MSELHLFDFDGTLFKSPDPPMWWDSGSWWADGQSLEPPCVPEKPGPEWWIGSTVTQAKRSIANPEVWTILCTGRNDRPFRWRVPELLHQKGLRFDEVFLNKGGGTAEFKKGILRAQLRKHPHIDTVHIWEDRPNHLKAFVSFVESLGARAFPHPIRGGSGSYGPAMEALCQENPNPPDPSKPPLYAGVILETKSKDRLKDWWLKNFGDFYSSKFAHHMTVMFKPTTEDLSDLPLGDTFALRVVGVAKDDKAMVVVVEPQGLKTQERTPHITISTRDGVKPAYSNRLLSKGWKKVDGPTVRGRLGWSNGKSIYFEGASTRQAMACRVAQRFLED